MSEHTGIACPLCHVHPARYAIVIKHRSTVVCGRCALHYGRLWRSSVVIAAIVGSVLISLDRLRISTVLRDGLTVTVPFLVSMSAGLMTARRLGTAKEQPPEPRNRPSTSPGG